jgi:regulator of sigma E protease
LSLLLGIPTFFIILAILIMVHELGHFTMAKLNGVRVDEFGLGFPPRLKTWRRGGTLYSVNAIPLGGFVKMLGENGEDNEPDSFGSKAPWRRLVILAAGPAMNLLLATLVLFAVFLSGTPKSIAVITKVAPGSPAQHAGLRVGDRILSLDGAKVQYLEDLQSSSQAHQGQRVALQVRRGSRTLTVHLIPRVNPPPTKGRIGVEMSKTTTVRYGPSDALRQATGQLGDMVGTLPTLAQNIANHNGGQVAGPIGIAQVTTQVVHQEPQNGLGSLFFFMALLSANLGILNLLPIPALDGGRIVFVLISWVRHRNLDPEVEGIIHAVGMAVLLLLILIVSYQDVVRWVSGGSF